MERKTVIFTPQELVKLTALLNNWPVKNHGQMVFVSKLYHRVELRKAEKELIGWQEVVTQGGQAFYQFNNDYELSRDLSKEDTDNLLHIAQNPPESMPWSFAELSIYNALIKKLGGEPITEEEEALTDA